MSVHLHAEPLAQELASAMQLRLAGALGDAEHLRRLEVRVAVEGMQDECIAGPFGERADRGLDLVHLDRGLQRPIGGLAFLLLRWRLDQSALAALGQAHVDRDAVQPSGQRAARLEFPERAPGIDESILRTVLRQLSVTRHPQAQTVDPPGMLAIQPLEGALVTRARPLNERSLPVDPRVLGLRVWHLSL